MKGTASLFDRAERRPFRDNAYPAACMPERMPDCIPDLAIAKRVRKNDVKARRADAPSRFYEQRCKRR
jgi:hypothetical protein